MCSIANQNMLRAEIFEKFNLNFHDLIFKVMHLDFSITTLTIIFPHVSIIM